MNPHQIIRLDPPYEFDTPKGSAICEWMIDRGPHANVEWRCFIKETGECWDFQNPQIRMAKNITMGIRAEKEPVKRVIGDIMANNPYGINCVPCSNP